MIEQIAVYAFITIAILYLLRSDLTHYLFTDKLEKWLLKRGYLFIHYGFLCDRCVGFWIVVALCISNPVLILPTYGLILVLIGVTNAKTSTV